MQSSNKFWQNRHYQIASATHFFVDVLSNGRSVLVALLAINLGMTNAQLGVNLIFYNLGSAVTQPLFGWLGDRIGVRWLVVGGMGWMIGCFTLASLLPDYSALVFATVAGLGSGSFHPAGIKVASESSKEHAGSATAVFFMFGQLGLFLGPVLAGITLDKLGRFGYIWLPMACLFIFIIGLNKFNPTQPNPHKIKVIKQGSHPPLNLRAIILMTVTILSFGGINMAIMTFSPKLFAELGYNNTYIGWLSGLFMMGYAFGGVAGGAWADRSTPRHVILFGLITSILPIYLFISADGLWRFILLFMAGFLNGMPHSLMILNVQKLFPNNRTMASGLALGGMFFGGSLVSLILGIIADSVGLEMALPYTAVLALIATFTTIALPKEI